MTLETTANKVMLAGDGTSIIFPFPFYFIDDEDLHVVLTDSQGGNHLLVPDSDYTVSGGGNPSGGYVTMASAPGSGESLTIYREVSLVQPTDYGSASKVRLATLEQDLDRLVMMAQQLQEAQDRTLKLSITSTQSPDTLIESLQANTIAAQAAAGDADAARADAESAAATATAAAAGVSLPPITESDDGSILEVNSSGEWELTEHAGLPVARPSLLLNFRGSRTLDPRFSFLRSTTGTYWGPGGLLLTAETNEPRFQHDPDTGECLGLLMEPQRTNRFTQCNVLNSVNWNLGRMTVSDNVSTSPTGSATMDKLVATTEDGVHHISQYPTAADNTMYVLSGYFRQAEYSNICLWIQDKAANTYNVIFDLSEATVLDADGLDCGVTFVGGGLFRCWAAVNVGSGGTAVRAGVKLVSSGTTTSFAGDGTSGIYAWGLQFEAGAAPSSLIFTDSATATRVDDTAVMVGLDDLLFPARGIGVVLEAMVEKGTDAQRLFSMATDADNEFRPFMDTSGGLQTYLVKGGDTEASSNISGAGFGEPFRAAWKIQSNYVRACLNGSLDEADTEADIPDMDTLTLGKTYAGAHDLHGVLSFLAIYGANISNTEMQALTEV